MVDRPDGLLTPFGRQSAMGYDGPVVGRSYEFALTLSYAMSQHSDTELYGKDYFTRAAWSAEIVNGKVVPIAHAELKATHSNVNALSPDGWIINSDYSIDDVLMAVEIVESFLQRFKIKSPTL